MRTKVHEKQKALELRKQGKSYREIQQKIKVSKGTLSHWFRDIELSKKEEKFLEERTRILQDKGRIKVASDNHKRNEARREKIRRVARETFYSHCNDPFFVLGLTLYWSSGSQTGSLFSFTTSDTEMIKLLMRWAIEYLHADPVTFRFRLYVPDRSAETKARGYWSRACEVPLSQFQNATYTNAKANRDSMGSMRLNISGSDTLLTVITWQNLLSEYYVGSR